MSATDSESYGDEEYAPRVKPRSLKEPKKLTCNITLGPVIGAVSDDAARILCEVDADVPEMVCSVYDETKKIVAQAFASFKANRPNVFKLTGLKQATKYSAVFNAANGSDLPATFTTHTEDPTHLRFAAFSCDKIKAANHDSHLANLLASHKKNPIDVFLHLGDQVYADDAYKDALKVVKKIGLKKARLEEEDNFVELYRRRYRETWNNKITRQLLASGSHLMIWDDHELVNDWGTPDIHRDKSDGNLAYFLGNVARRAYYEYQKQLWEDISDDLDAHLVDSHVHVFGNIGVLFLDLRGGRSFHHDSNYSANFLGPAQWTMIDRALSNDGLFKRCRALIVASSIPLSYSSAVMSCCIGALFPCIRDKMGFALHRPEQNAVFERLYQWKENLPGREILALAGDMHASCEGHVTKGPGGAHLLTQVITSPIANRPPKGFKFAWMKWMSAKVNTFWGSKFSFRRTVPWVNKRNFTLVNVNCENLKDPSISWEIVHES